QIGPVFAGTDSAEQNHSEHKESDNSLLIKANEYDFLPNSINVDVGETVTLSVENTGTVEHDLEIVDFNSENVQQDESHNKEKKYRFLRNSRNVDVGETVTLSVENTSTVEHDLEIVDFNPDNVQQDDSHNHGQNANTIHLHATPGEKQTVSFTPSEKGEYRFICTIPGHQESGMIGTMDVS